MNHQSPSPLAGKEVKIKKESADLGGKTLRVEDYWDRIAGKSWRNSDGNPAALGYAMRTGLGDMRIPNDDEVVYGKIGGLGYLVHLSELELEAPVA